MCEIWLKSVHRGLLYNYAKYNEFVTFCTFPFLSFFLLVAYSNKKAVLPQGNRAMPQLFFFGLKFSDDIHYKFMSSHASFEARLQSSKHTVTKQNLTQNGDSRSFKVTCFGVSGKAIVVLSFVNVRQKGGMTSVIHTGTRSRQK